MVPHHDRASSSSRLFVDGTTSTTTGSPLRRAPNACLECRNAKVRCHGTPGHDPCVRCKAMEMPCYFPPSRRGRPLGAKNRRSMSKTSVGGSSSLPRNLLKVRGRQSRSPSATTDPPALEIQPEHRTFMRIWDLAVLSSLRDSFPVDGKDRDPPPSAAFKDSSIDANDFRGAAQSMVDAAAKALQTQNPIEPKLPDVPLPSDALEKLKRWTGPRLRHVFAQQRQYYQTGLYGSKRDVAMALDPVEHGLLSEDRVSELFQAYWKYTHPYCCVLDPQLHTPAFVRSRSVFLFSVILAVAATVLTTQPDCSEADVVQAAALMAHVEKLHIVSYAAGVKSLEIVQAMIIWTDNSLAPPTMIDDDRWLRIAAVQRMAFQVGVHLPRKSRTGNREREARMKLNDLRTRIWLLILDTKYFVFQGGAMSSLSHFELSAEDMQILQEISPLEVDAMIPAYHDLHMFQRRMPERIAVAQSSPDADIALEAEHTMVDSYIDRWIIRWCPVGGDEMRNWLFRLEASGVRLLFHLRILRHQGPDIDFPKHYAHLLQVAEFIFEDALAHDHVAYFAFKTGYILFAAHIILRLGDRRDLILRMALRMAGDPERPPINTSTKYNGYQMLSMLSSTVKDQPESSEVDSPQVPLSFDDLLAGLGDGPVNIDDFFNGDSEASRANQFDWVPVHGDSSWRDLFGWSSDAFEYTRNDETSELPAAVDLFSSAPAQEPWCAQFPRPNQDFRPLLGDLAPLAQAIAQQVDTSDQAGVQSQILGALQRLAGPA